MTKQNRAYMLNKGQNPLHIGLGLAKAALHLARHGETSAIDLANEAAKLARCPATLAARCTVAHRLFNVAELEDAVSEAEGFTAKNDALEDVLARMNAGPLAAVSLSRLLENRYPLDFKPVAERVLYVLHKSLPFANDGYATRSHGIARGLTALGTDLVCLTRPGFPTDVIQTEFSGGLDRDCEVLDGVHYLRISSPSRAEFPPLPVEDMMHASFAYLERSASRMVSVMRQYRPSCVIAGSNLTTALPACLAAHSLGLPFVYEVRGFWELTRASSNPDYLSSSMGLQERFLETAIARAADRVITLTTPMLDELVARGVDRKFIRLAPNACDPSVFLPTTPEQSLLKLLNLSDSTPIIGYVGSFNQYEGLDDLVCACARLRREGLNFRLLLVGSEPPDTSGGFPLTQKIRNMAASEGLSDWLILPGRVPHHEVAKWYSIIDIAPFPRKSLLVTELVSPLKPLEALAMQKAVVVSDVGGMREVIEHRKTGLVTPSDNSDALADSLRILLQDDAYRRGVGMAGREWICRRRTWQHSAAQILDAIEPLLAC